MTGRILPRAVVTAAMAVLCTLAVPASRGQDAQVPPAETTRPGLSDRLGSLPGAFHYDFGAAGWPSAVSLFGADPADGRISVDGVPLDDPFTGRPLLELAPVLLTGMIRVTPDGTIRLTTRDLEEPRPLTLVRYQSTGDGLQAADVLHVQQRSPGYARGGRVQTVFSYAGAGGSGEYDGSALRRARQITLRMTLTTERGWLRVMDRNTRHRVGAHAGVEPFNASYESIYQRLGASVANEDDERQMLRNDLSLAGGTTVRGRPVEALAYRSWFTHTFLTPTGDVRQRTQRLGLDATVGVADWRGLRLDAVAAVRRTDDLGFADLRAALAAADSSWTVRPGLMHTDGRWHAAVDGSIRVASQALHVSWAPVEESLDFRTAGAGAPPRVAAARLDLRLDRGPWRAAATPFVRHMDRLRVYSGDDRDRTVHALDAAAIRYGLSASFGLDTGALYAWISPTVQASSVDLADPVATAWEEAIPDWWLEGRLGTRHRLFQDDLDLDASVRVRAWPGFRGRTLHTPTGLLILREAGSREVPPASAIDLIVEGRIRGATLFLAWENVLSGTNLLPGNQLVPDYPLPEQRIRFGVYWPITN